MYTCKEIMPTIEHFQFKHMQATIIKQKMDNGQISHTIARRRPVAIPITFDFPNETITIGSTTFKTRYNGEFTYNILQKSKVIEVISYEGLVRHIKQASEKNSVWHITMWGMLKRIAKDSVLELN